MKLFFYGMLTVMLGAFIAFLVMYVQYSAEVNMVAAHAATGVAVGYVVSLAYEVCVLTGISMFVMILAWSLVTTL